MVHHYVDRDDDCDCDRGPALTKEEQDALAAVHERWRRAALKHKNDHSKEVYRLHVEIAERRSRLEALESEQREIERGRKAYP